MLANPYQGEVVVRVNNVPHVARLTLAALAALETTLGDSSLDALLKRFETGKPSANDILSILRAGLRGGGWPGEGEDLMRADFGNATEAAQAAAQLIVYAFGGGHE